MFLESIRIKQIISWAVLVFCISVISLNTDLNSILLTKKENTKILKTSTSNPLLFFRPIDINHASFEVLKEIPGVGIKEADKILDFIHSQGFLFSIYELEFPEGPLSAKQFQRIKVYICVR